MPPLKGFPHLLLIKLHSILGNARDDDVLQLPFVYLAVAIGVVHLVGLICVISFMKLTRLENDDDEHGGEDDENSEDKVMMIVMRMMDDKG